MCPCCFKKGTEAEGTKKKGEEGKKISNFRFQKEADLVGARS